MAVDYTKISFSSDKPIDKILYESEVLQYTVGGGATTTETVPHGLGEQVFVTMAWSVNNTDFYPAQAVVDASNPYLANAWADSSDVYIYLDNAGSGGSTTFYIKYVLDSIE